MTAGLKPRESARTGVKGHGHTHMNMYMYMCEGKDVHGFHMYSTRGEKDQNAKASKPCHYSSVCVCVCVPHIVLGLFVDSKKTLRTVR